MKKTFITVFFFKKKPSLLRTHVIVIALIIGLIPIARIFAAEFETKSNIFETAVGNPVGSRPGEGVGGDFPDGGTVPTGKFSCPFIAGGKFSCGSKYTPKNGCAHCVAPAYDPTESQCTAKYKFGTFSASDISRGPNAASRGQALTLPLLGSNTIEWTLVYNSQSGTSTTETILGFSGFDTIEKKRYYMQFHHSQPTNISIGTKFKSGSIGPFVCTQPNPLKSNCDHSHIQIATGGIDVLTNQSSWIDSAQAFACN